ncbi:MAG: PilZ domain-containing protein [Nanoarchaeota archaeon]|nr:PilZ domain-containing protein [Nanoarchaeota archaeon]
MEISIKKIDNLEETLIYNIRKERYTNLICKSSNCKKQFKVLTDKLSKKKSARCGCGYRFHLIKNRRTYRRNIEQNTLDAKIYFKREERIYLLNTKITNISTGGIQVRTSLQGKLEPYLKVKENLGIKFTLDTRIPTEVKVQGRLCSMNKDEKDYKLRVAFRKFISGRIELGFYLL